MDHYSEDTNLRGSFLYGGPLHATNNNNSSSTTTSSSSLYGRNSSSHQSHMMNMSKNIDSFHDQLGENFIVKSEAGGSGISQNILYPNSVIRGMQVGSNNSENFCRGDVEFVKAKIISHPQYSNLLEAYMDCQKVGAPPEVAAQLTAVREEFEARQRASMTCNNAAKDPELDQFMEAYYDMVVKYRMELTRPIEEALDFMRRIEAQLNILNNSDSKDNIASGRIYNSDEKGDPVEEDQDNSVGETEMPEIDPKAEDQELKNYLLRKYSGYLGSLKQELSKKKKKGKLPKDARQKLLNWWEFHYKWPYPSETEKVALAESTGLDQKQINNWFINQRKRHWKPSEDMQFMVMDGIHPQSASICMDEHFMNEGPYRLGP